MLCPLKIDWHKQGCKLKSTGPYFWGTLFTFKILWWLWTSTRPLLHLPVFPRYSSPVSAATSSECHPLWAHLALGTTFVTSPPCVTGRRTSLLSSHCPVMLTIGLAGRSLSRLQTHSVHAPLCILKKLLTGVTGWEACGRARCRLQFFCKSKTLPKLNVY